jgi:predicted GIY-YIG superfamily endonuclease
MAIFHYVYILVSLSHPNRHYTGLTSNLNGRLEAHNFGQIRSTSEHRPWRVDVAVAFHSRQKARAFEVYLKSHSGRAFAKKHF